MHHEAVLVEFERLRVKISIKRLNLDMLIRYEASDNFSRQLQNLLRHQGSTIDVSDNLHPPSEEVICNPATTQTRCN